ncbi:MAG: hypothetical protein WBV69_15930 [Candidatus Sulfotelmatobacter sp.]
MRVIRSLLPALITIASTMVVAQFSPGVFSGAESSLLHRWDPTHGVLFFRRSFLLQKTSPPLRSYYEDGSQRGAEIDLFKDFPDAEKASVSDFAAGPAGTTVIASELIYDRGHGKNVILTYDWTGNLLRALAIDSAEAITTDEQGDIYVLGQGNDPNPGNPPNPLLVEFDPSGRVIGRFLDSSTFKTGSDAIEDFGPGDEMVSASVMVSDEKLYIYAPSERQVLVCSLDGRILRRAALEDVGVKIARADKVNRAAISDVAFVDENHVALYLTEHVDPEEPHSLDYSNMHTAIYLIDLTAKSFRLILRGEPGTNPAFLGTKGNQLLTLTRKGQGFDIQAHDLF